MTTDIHDVEIPDATFDAIEAQGERDGRSAASWVWDGNTPDDVYRRFIALNDDGEAGEEFGYAPPLSGEWADGPTVRTLIEDHASILSGEDVTTERDNELILAFGDDVADRYEDGYSRGWFGELSRVANLHTS